MGKKITAVTAALILIAVGYYFVQQKSASKPDGLAVPEISSPSDYIPSVEGVSAYMLMEVGDTRSLHSVMSYLPGLVDRIGQLPMPNGILGADAHKIPEAVDFLTKARDLVGASDAMTIYVTSADVPGLYVSMFVDDEKFDPLIKSGNRQLTRTEEWADREGDAWILRPETSEDALFVTRTHIGDKSVVNISGEEEAIEAMLKAAADPSKRLNIERQTEEPNFIRIKLDEPAEIEGRKVSETELSWNRSDEHVRVRWFSDMFDGISDRIVIGDFTPKAPPVMGNGELAVLASIDPMFLIYTILPNEDDPAKAFFEQFGGGIPSQFAGDLEAILRECRVSAAIVTSGDAVSTAYLTIDTAAEGALDRLYGIAGLFLGGGRELEGWDSVLNVPTGTPLGAIAAKRGGTVLLGVGDFEEYTHSAEIPGSLETITSKSNALGIMAVPGRLEMSEGFVTDMLRSGALDVLNRFLDFVEPGDMINFDWVDRFTATQSFDGRINIDIYMRK